MNPPAFDASEYRRTVLTPLRSANPATVQDVFWLGHVPRDLDDAAEITTRLAAAKAFLHKERSRPRQADVAAAVLKEWSRVEGVLADPAARRALRARLDGHAPGAEVVGATSAAPSSGASAGASAAQDGSTAAGSGALRLRQVRTALDELARITGEPELAEDLFAFLGLPISATPEMVGTRVALVADANRKRRADRERSLVDELLMHSRELLVDGDPAAYRAALAGDLSAFAAQEPAPSTPPALATTAPDPVPESAEPGRIDYTRRRQPAPPAATPSAAEPPAATPSAATPPAAEPAAPTPAVVDALPAVSELAARRDPSGTVVVTWTWPYGVTEAFVAVGVGAHPDTAAAPSRKVTNTKYEIDGGAKLDGVDPGATLAVFSGRRDAAGRLVWSPAVAAPATIAP